MTLAKDSFTSKPVSERLDFLKSLSEQTKRELLEESMVIELKNGSVLFTQNEPAYGFYIVLSGSVKLLRESAGVTSLLHLVTPSEMIGSILMQEDLVLNYPVSAVSVGESEVLRIPREIFLRSWCKEPFVSEVVQKQMFKRLMAIKL